MVRKFSDYVRVRLSFTWHTTQQTAKNIALALQNLIRTTNTKTNISRRWRGWSWQVSSTLHDTSTSPSNNIKIEPPSKSPTKMEVQPLPLEKSIRTGLSFSSRPGLRPDCVDLLFYLGDFLMFAASFVVGYLCVELVNLLLILPVWFYISQESG